MSKNNSVMRLSDAERAKREAIAVLLRQATARAQVAVRTDGDDNAPFFSSEEDLLNWIGTATAARSELRRDVARLQRDVERLRGEAAVVRA